MNTKQIATIAGVILVVGGVLGFAIAKLTSTQSVQSVNNYYTQAAPTGATFNTAKVAEVVMAPISKTATTSAIYNSDVADRIVLDAFVWCTGLSDMAGMDNKGVASFRWWAATSTTDGSTATSTIAGSQLAAMVVDVSTSSPIGYTASSTYTGNYSRIWNSGTYMRFQTNATSSATRCTPGVHYLGQ